MEAPRGGAARQIVAARLRRKGVLYVRSDAIVVADADGRARVSLDVGAVRSAVAPDPLTVRVTWSDGAGEGRSYYDVELDAGRAHSGKMGARPAAASLARAIVAAAGARLAAEAGPERREEAERMLRRAALEAGGGAGGGGEGAGPRPGRHSPSRPPPSPLEAGPCAGRLVLAPGERVVGSYGGVRWSHGCGDACVTDRGLYLVDPAKGLCIDLPLALFEGCTVSNRTVSVRHAGGGAARAGGAGRGGRAPASFDLRVPGAGAQALAGDMLGAYSACGEAGARRLAELEGRFALLAPGGLLEEAYGRQCDGEEGGRELDEYARLLAARRWGAPPAAGAETYDHRVAAACILAGLPVEAAGGMTGRDRRLHEALRRHAEARAEYESRMRPLLADLFEMQAGGLSGRERRRLLAVPHWRIIHEAVEEAARPGRRAGAPFVPPTAKRYVMLAADVNARMLPGGGGGGAGGLFEFDRIADAMQPPCPWTAGEASRILGRRGYAEAVAECDRIRARHGMLDIVSPRVLSLLAGRPLRDEARVRAARVYKAWAAGGGAGGGEGERAPPPFEDPYDYSWMRHLADSVAALAPGADEMIRAHLGMDAGPMAMLREAHARSLEARVRVSGAAVPPSVPRSGVHGDAWYDPESGEWMTANPLGLLASSPLAVRGPDECERLHGVRAAAFDASDVSTRHGMPAVAHGGEEGGGAWILLPTVPDSAVTRSMVVDKELGLLEYACAEPDMCVSNEGLLCPYTHAEYVAICGSDRSGMPAGSEAREWAAGSAVLPLPERLRRFEFAVRTDLFGIRPDR